MFDAYVRRAEKQSNDERQRREYINTKLLTNTYAETKIMSPVISNKLQGRELSLAQSDMFPVFLYVNIVARASEVPKRLISGIQKSLPKSLLIPLYKQFDHLIFHRTYGIISNASTRNYGQVSWVQIINTDMPSL